MDPILDVLSKTGDFTGIFDSKLSHYGTKIIEASKKLDDLLKKVTAFLNSIQLRQKGLSSASYKSWDQYTHCSSDVCLRLIRRSSKLYLNLIFPLKFPHLDDLSSTSLANNGKWPVPGLFDDYKIRSIEQLSSNEMLLGMKGVGVNTGKASLLVVVRIQSSQTEILKIIQIKKDGKPFPISMGGIVILKSILIWIAHDDALYAVKLSDVRASMASKRPTTIAVVKNKAVPYKVLSISYDSIGMEVWVLDGKRSYSYAVSPNGDILNEMKQLTILEPARGFTIVRQYGIKYGCLAKCELVIGYQCRIEFHNVSTGVLSESSILRVVRTPSGLEAVQTVGEDKVIAAFSSAVISEKENIERIGGDFEDRFFRMYVPVLKTEFTITENCLYFQVEENTIIPRSRLVPFGEKKCGNDRKRRSADNIFERDIYTKELARVRRSQRQTNGEISCLWNHDVELAKGEHHE